jgi:hypothetical protein
MASSAPNGSSIRAAGVEEERTAERRPLLHAARQLRGILAEIAQPDQPQEIARGRDSA